MIKAMILIILLVISSVVQAFYVIGYIGYIGEKCELNPMKMIIIICSVIYTVALAVAMLILGFEMSYEDIIISKKQIRMVLVIENSKNLTLEEKEIITKRNKDMHKILFEQED